MKKNINTNGITDDLDILLIKVEDKISDKQALEYFISGLQKEISSYKVTYEGQLDNINKFFKIYLGGSRIIDLTIYKHDDSNDDDTSMFFYAATKIGFNKTHDYVSKLINYYGSKCFNELVEELITDELIENITFTGLIFEYHSSIKGLELQTENIIKFESGVWLNKLNNMKTYSPERVHDIARLENQVTLEYLALLKDKKLRYEQKIDVIKKIIGQ
jgi:hypothetical protein